MTKDEKIAEAKMAKHSSEGLFGGYIVGLLMAAFIVMGNLTVFGIFAAIFLGLLGAIAVYWSAKLNGLETGDD